MTEPRLSTLVRDRVRAAAHALQTVDPLPLVGGIIDRSFSLPAGDEKYGGNALTPGAAPFEPSFSERQPGALRFTLEPLGPESSSLSRRDEATRETRRLVGPVFGSEALRWFDGRSEEWRGHSSPARLDYGAWFGTSFDRDGLAAVKVYYELQNGLLHGLSPRLAAVVRSAVEVMPSLVPVFTSISCRADSGTQRVTFFHRGPLRLAALDPLMRRLGLAHQLPGLMQIIGLALGGRFQLPARSVLLGLGESADGPELKVEVMLGRIPDLPDSFLGLLELGLSERPRELRALRDWLAAFSPRGAATPGQFSVLSVRVSRSAPARISVYVRPVEFEISSVIAGEDAGEDDDDDLRPLSAGFSRAS